MDCDISKKFIPVLASSGFLLINVDFYGFFAKKRAFFAKNCIEMYNFLQKSDN